MNRAAHLPGHQVVLALLLIRLPGLDCSRLLAQNQSPEEYFRQASISWVRDRADSRVDFMIGWVEFEGDFLSRMAAWESLRQGSVPKRRRWRTLAKH